MIKIISRLHYILEDDLNKEDLITELKLILTRSVFLNIAAYLISIIFIGFTLPMAAGLFLGTFGMLLNLFLLNKSICDAVKMGGSKKMVVWYIIRMTIVSLILVMTMMWCVSCMIGSLIPFVYPKLVYGGKTLFRKGGKAE